MLILFFEYYFDMGVGVIMLDRQSMHMSWPAERGGGGCQLGNLSWVGLALYKLFIFVVSTYFV